MWAVYLTLFIVLALILLFLFEFAKVSQSEFAGQATNAAATSDVDVAALIASGDPANGDELLTVYGCAACHRATTDLAPSFVGLAERAATRRPPLTAGEYVYESITRPDAYVVEGYPSGLMPPIYSNRLSDQDLADIIAYL